MTALSPRRDSSRRPASAAARLARRRPSFSGQRQRAAAVGILAADGSRGLSGRAAYRHLRAPQKHLYSYPDAGHATAFEHADDVRRILARTLASSTHHRSP